MDVPECLSGLRHRLREPINDGSCRGVYFLINEGDVVYVGQSVEVVRRVKEHKHIGDKEFSNALFMPVPGPMYFAEYLCIWLLRPKYNIDGLEHWRLENEV